jgi:hypothetical protein
MPHHVDYSDPETKMNYFVRFLDAKEKAEKGSKKDQINFMYKFYDLNSETDFIPEISEIFHSKEIGEFFREEELRRLTMREIEDFLKSKGETLN